MEVKTLTSSGMIAPASVPQVMTRRKLPPQRWIAAQIGNHEVGNDVGGSDRNDRSQPDEERQRRFVVELGQRSDIWPWRSASLMKYETPEEITIMTRMTKIQTSSCT